MSSDTSKIAIVLQEDEGHVVISWEVENNSEYLTHDVTSDFKVIWDSLGEMYILNNDGVFFS